ncbi:MAG TPA: glycosyltransferase family 2 protein [Bryobacteraceae bacterium]
MIKPLVSILIPAHNAEKWLTDAVRSALAQTWDRKEIIIVDDGSSDRTLALARGFESEVIRVVTQKNQGASAARNTAFSLSRGDYIQWLDADDLLAPTKIERQLAARGTEANRRILLSCPWGRFMYRPNRARFVPTSLWCDLTPVEFLLRKMKDRVFMQTSVWLVSRELTESAGSWDTSMLGDDDGEYFCRVVLASHGIRFVPEAKVFYRDTGSASLSSTGRNDRKLEALWLSKRLHIDYLRSLEDSERTRVASMQYLQHYLIYYYPFRPDIAEAIHRVASELGGQLEVPRMSWKYEWLRRLAGWTVAKWAQLLLSRFKWAIIRWSDRVMLRAEGDSYLEKSLVER